MLSALAVLCLWLVWVAVPERATRGAADALVSVVGPEPLPTAAVPAPVLATATPTPRVSAAPTTAVQGTATTGGPAPATAVPEAGPEDVPRSASGSFVVAGGGTGPVGRGGTSVRYTVEVEDGLPFDAMTVATEVDGVLGDDRSWTGLGRWTLQRVDGGGDARILLASPDTVDRLCAPLRTSGTFSCRNGPLVVVNALRWAGGADSWGDDVAGYRAYLVNHEFGHFLGYGHVGCPGDGEPAPVMMQQTKSVEGCVPNAWPTVTGG
ncbi:MAG: DUF3152 domain-containing protein [Kineosporiaceae bacterium]